ncbi:MAG: metal-dependent transcriptional regulator [Gemmatimonadota bacterium]|nr:metal-dependent transcriptional regulator [Gemmatimonadota bacterium]
MMTRHPATEPLTHSAEDYLKAIYTLSGDAPASTSQIANRLELAPASVSGMIRRLSDQGLLDHEPYRGVLLTDAGRVVALRMVRRHRLIEAYLVEFLGYGWEDVHAEAERLEHAVSETLIERMAAALGHPSVDPHGDPIPGPDGAIDEPDYVPLALLEPGEVAELRRVGTNHAGRLRYIAELGLLPGVPVTVVARQPFEGPVTIRVNDTKQVVAHDLALLLLCVRDAND